MFFLIFNRLFRLYLIAILDPVTSILHLVPLCFGILNHLISEGRNKESLKKRENGIDRQRKLDKRTKKIEIEECREYVYKKRNLLTYPTSFKISF